MTLATNPPWWAIVSLCLVAAAVAYVAYARPVVPLTVRQRGLLVTLRLTALLLIALFLLRPVSTEPSPRSGGVVPVLIDVSQSMRVADASARTRIERAVELARDEILPALETDFDVEVLSFGDELQVLDLSQAEARASRTDLAGALDSLGERYSEQPIVGVVVLSDGGDTSGVDLASAASALARQVYTVGLGAPLPSLDVEVASVTAGAATVSESVVDVVVSVVSHGRGQEPIEVRIEEDGQLLDARRVTPSADGAPNHLVFQVSPKSDAATLYTVEIPTVEHEAIVENNRQSVLVRPPGRPRRLLMIEGAPGYEHSFLKRVWLADPGIELDAVVRKGQNEVGEHTFYIQASPDRSPDLATGYPVDRSALFQYDAVILANVEFQSFRPDQLSMMADFVAERGGGLLALGSLSLTGLGLQGSPLEKVLPLETSDRRRQEYEEDPERADRAMLTEDGAVHPIMQLGVTVSETRDKWATLPRLGGSIRLGAARPGASVLALVSAPGGDLRPLLAVQRYGRGRSMVFAGEGAWRWKMLLPVDDRRYDRVWGQVARWLTAGASEPVTVTTTGGRMPGDRVSLDLYVRDAEFRPVLDADRRIRVRTPSGDIEGLDAVLADAATGRHTTEFVAREPGVYRVEVSAEARGEVLGSATDWVLVGGVEAEWVDPRLNEPLLARLAASTGGQLLDVAEVSTLSEILRAARAVDTSPTNRELWHGFWSFLLVVVVLTTEWSLRRAWGLR